MSFDDIAASIRLVQTDRPPGGPRYERCLVRNPLGTAAAMAVANHKFGLSPPRGH